MKHSSYIFFNLLILGLISYGCHKSIVSQQECASTKVISNVSRSETGNYFLFVHSSDTILLSKNIKGLSTKFQTDLIIKLFYQDQKHHKIMINNLNEESNISHDIRQKYFRAEGFLLPFMNQIEWLIRVENLDVKKAMDLEDFIKKATVTIEETKVQI